MVLTGDEMTNKFTIGSQWTTKGGWRAVVVGVDHSGVKTWHEHKNWVVYHFLDGSAPGEPDFALITPYTEPRKGTVWVNVYADKDDGEIFTASYPSENDMESEQPDYEDLNCELIASFKHDWTENEKL